MATEFIMRTYWGDAHQQQGISPKIVIRTIKGCIERVDEVGYLLSLEVRIYDS